MIATFGCPAEIRSDQGTQFTSDEFRQWCESLGIKRVLTPVANPWSNTVERLIRTVNQIIRTNMASRETEWQLILPAAALAYN
ncbi:MAG: transposase family protein, partial [Gammaproteobacteria bacterium]|nr:transposase family protein [Gammaproteobacteria bacterium]